MVNLVCSGIRRRILLWLVTLVGVDNSDNIETKKCIGTSGLWKLLTNKPKYAPDEKFYTMDNYRNYIKMLSGTQSIYKNNASSTGKPKSGKGGNLRIRSPVFGDTGITLKEVGQTSNCLLYTSRCV